jgi:hypothetical protein
MGWFRRRNETLNEKLAREAGLETGAEAPAEPFEPKPRYGGPSWFGGGPLLENPAITGNARPREWDAVVTTDVPGLAGNEVAFVALPDGTLIVEQEEGDTSLDPLANAVETRLDAPYRARAVRQTETLWAVSARRIDVATFEGAGDVVELTRTADENTLTVDGEQSFGTLPALERIGEERYGRAFAVHAERIDGDAWEIRGVSL